MKSKLFTVIGVFISLFIFAQHDQDTNVVKNQYGVVVERHPLDPESRSGILTFVSKDKSYKFWLDNRVYLDGGYYFDKNAYNPIGNGVTIRRARFAVKAILYNNWYGELDLDFSGAEMEMKDMIVGYVSRAKSGLGKNVRIKAGHFKEGISMEQTTTSRYVTFIERSLRSKLVPSRHLGIQLTKYDKHWLFIGGMHFQPVGELEENTISKDHNKKDGTDEGYSLDARAVVMPINTENAVLHIGAAYSYRTPKTTWEYPNTFRYSTRSISSINRKKYLDTDDISNIENIGIFNAELAGAYKGFMFQAEYTTNSINGTDVNNVSGINNAKLEGAYAQVGVILFGGNYRYNNAEGELTQISTGNDWGDVEVAFRYDYINMNDFDAQIYGGGANAYTFGINYYVNTNVKFMLNYSYLNHDRYANGKGKLYVGHDADGNLTKDFTEVIEESGKGGDDYGMIQARIEIDF